MRRDSQIAPGWLVFASMLFGELHSHLRLI